MFTLRKNRRSLRVESLERRELFSIDSGWGFGLGAAGSDLGYGVYLDDGGSSYVTGRFDSAGFDADPGAGVATLTPNGGGDGYLAKYSANRSLEWALSFGGPAQDRAWHATTDAAQNVYLTGVLESASVQLGGHTLVNQTASGTGIQPFVAKLNSAGNVLWAKNVFAGGNGSDFTFQADVDDLGNIFLPGRFDGSVDFDPANAGGERTSAGASDAFVLKLDSAGAFQWVETIGGVGADTNWELELDAAGNIYTSGSYRDTAQLPDMADNTPVSLTSDSLTGGGNGFLLKLDADGNTVWAIDASSTDSVTHKHLELDGAGNLYTVGVLRGDAEFPSGTLTTNGKFDMFASKWTTDGDFQWVSQLTGSGDNPTDLNDVTSLALDGAGNAYLGGQFAGTMDFDPGAGSVSHVASATDGYVAKLDANGALSWVKPVTGADNQNIRAVDALADGTVHAVGWFRNQANLPTGEVLTNANTYDAVTFKIAPAAPTKFFVVDGTADNTHEYDAGGNRTDNYALTGANTNPRGAASNLAGDKVWVIDANKKVYVYDNAGGLLGSWTANGLSSPSGITTNGTDIWIVDSSTDRVYKYAGAASRLSGSQSAASNFKLNNQNGNAADLVTNGANIWTVNSAATDKVFRYSMTGSLQGSWTIDSRNTSPTGITLDPASPSTLWIVDNAADQVFAYAGATSRTSGSQSASIAVNLGLGNSDPQGIADPPTAAEAALIEVLEEAFAQRASRRVELRSNGPHDSANLAADYVFASLAAAAEPSKPKRLQRA